MGLANVGLENVCFSKDSAIEAGRLRAQRMVEVVSPYA